ncbi:hypothetical protein [Pseudooceanicola sp. MF1-13]|uniref:hypothetical protein n=1 Tax=Pseudooceanicola sp. MF1-13 TaxID=3379095 RepID=UPI0038915AF5
MGILRTVGVVCAMALAGCVTPSGTLEQTRVNFNAADPSPQAFKVCGDIGCANQVPVSLTRAEWRHVQRAFPRRARTPGEERKFLAEALRRLEVMVGDKTGYNTDEAFSGIQLSGNTQDCIDEMVNAAVYLELLDNAGYLRHHQQGRRLTLGMMTRRFWTHTVVTIVQRSNGQEFIIDTWAVKIGELPYIMDRDAWATNEPFRRDF